MNRYIEGEWIYKEALLSEIFLSPFLWQNNLFKGGSSGRVVFPILVYKFLSEEGYP